MTIVLNGKELAQSIRTALRIELDNLRTQGIQPLLSAIIVGDNPASEKYVVNKRKMCRSIGINSEVHVLQRSSTLADLEHIITTCNNDSRVNGILVQLPLEHLSLPPTGTLKELTYRVMETIDPCKDVDGFHMYNITKYIRGQACLPPATAHGIINLLDYYKIPLKGQDVVIIGVSEIVGRPLGNVLTTCREATVSFCHKETHDLLRYIRTADIVVSAIGKPHYFSADAIKQDAVIIDVGINRVPDVSSCDGYQIVGDFDQTIWGKASYATPVPGGVGPMTVATLMQNVIVATKLQHGYKH